MKKEPSYNERVFTFLNRMEAGTISLDVLCTPETREKFIETVQSYIDKGKKDGYCIDFDSSFTKIVKFKEEIFSYLDRMPAGTVLLTELCEYQNPDKTIEIVKLYIDKKSFHNGYCTEFVQNYTAVRKFDTIMRTSIQKFKETI